MLFRSPCLTPASPYAATKRMNELQLSAYRDLFGLGVHALRFFTVYGPRQRPDMAIAKFTQAIARGQPVTLFGDGTTRRDYTYIDDIVDGVVGAMAYDKSRYEVVNLGNNQTVTLTEMIEGLEDALGRRAVIDRLPEQPGDVPQTWASIDKAQRLIGYRPSTSYSEGVRRFAEWFTRGSGGVNAPPGAL